MATEAKPRRWRRFRMFFRGCRIAVLLILLALVGAVLYLDSVGLPNFIKQPLLEKLHARGLDLQFSRLRWRPDRGIVAENVFFGRTNDVASPHLTLKEVQVRLDYAALLKRRLQVESLLLRQGQLTWPVISSNEPRRELTIDNIQTELQLLTNDVWELDDLQAQVAGARIQLSGAVTNASAIREWKIFHGRQPPQAGALQDRLRRLADTLEQIHFAAPPALKLDVRGDARHVENIAVRLFLEAPGADTPWGTAEGLRSTVLLAPPGSNQLSRAEINLRARTADTPWAATTNLILTLQLFSTQQDTNLVHAELNLTAESAQSHSNHAENVHFAAHWDHSLTNAIPLSGQGELEGSNAVTAWGSARQFSLSATLLPATNAPAVNSSWAWWTNVARYPLTLECDATGIHSPKLDLDEIHCSGKWRAPELAIEKLSAKLYGGKLDAGATLNVATREVTFNVASDFDGQKIAPLLTPMARNWLANYSWNYPPRVKASGAMVLPASVWTNRHPDWRGELRPTLKLDGEFHVVDGAFRGVRVLTADSHFSYSNMCWRLPDLIAIRREGLLTLYHFSDERTKDFYFHFHSTISPDALRPLLDAKQQRPFQFFSLSQPPTVDGEIRGKWHNHDTINAKAHLAVTNFTVRGSRADLFQTGLEYTNHIITLLDPRAQLAATQEVTASGVRLAFDEQRIYITNGFGFADPAVIARAIGPHAERALEPYHFQQPPTVRVQGAIPMRDPHDADLSFDVDGRDFSWWKFQVPHISGKIAWNGEHLALKDVQTDFYGGKASGDAEFYFLTNHSVDYRFNFVATDANLHSLATDLTDGKTNALEGHLTTRLEITAANSADWRHCQGAGRVDLRDGLIWDIPIFGVFSPVLDTMMPGVGLGNSRAREGSATFTITNGVIDSEDLKIETRLARLRYRGTIDLQGAVNARMEAEMLRNTWVVGPVLSLVLWPVSKTFEYKITGSIHKPKSDPIYVPKILFFPLRPVQTIKDLMPAQNDSPTNSPPGLFP
ncbi:MAG TPA: AsmA-like C-terminal region-containing protein [Candidatus Angelobacter sp.]|nr:AsmA-like C-terminal region-containing protein [Candidatus Angelobacter sp.]